MSAQIAPELDEFQLRMFRDIDRLVKALEGVDSVTANAKPLASANSLFALASHTLGAAEWLILGRICGQAEEYEDGPDLVATGDHAAILDRASAVKDRIAAGLSTLVPSDLDAMRKGRTRLMTVREILIMTVAHGAEHAGHADLTRDLLLARMKSSSAPGQSPS